MNERLAQRIVQARRELRIAEGVASQEEIEAAARDQVNASLDMVASYLLGLAFAWDGEGPVATLAAEELRFKIRWNGSHDLVLRETDSKRVLLSVAAGDPQSANRIVRAIADAIDRTHKLV